MEKFLLLFLVSSACRGQSASTTSSSETPAAETPGSVELRIAINPKLFNKGAKINLVILNQDDIAAEARNNKKYQNCVGVTEASTSKTSIRCPGGISYEPEAVSSEIRSVIVDKIETTWVLVTPHLQTGSKYALAISGLSPDGCNTVSTNISGIVKTNVVELKGLAWSQTDMGCSNAE